MLAGLAAAGLGAFFLQAEITLTMVIGILCVLIGLAVALFRQLLKITGIKKQVSAKNI